MKSLKIIAPGLAALSGLFLVSCQPDPVYVPVYVPIEKKAAPKKTTYKPAPKPVETAEGFRAVEKPTTYSN
jgi:hypothetical protein